ncbi:MAG TPA: DUF2892 domain-containing protein [Armatimonadota bacterium]|jgi:hypothetical protein
MHSSVDGKAPLGVGAKAKVVSNHTLTGKQHMGSTSGLTIDRQVRLIVGTCVLLGTAVPRLSPLAYLMGAGLVFAGITNTCAMASLLERLPWNREPASCQATRPRH